MAEATSTPSRSTGHGPARFEAVHDDRAGPAVTLHHLFPVTDGELVAAGGQARPVELDGGRLDAEHPDPCSDQVLRRSGRRAGPRPAREGPR